jgi:hypothetical protein
MDFGEGNMCPINRLGVFLMTVFTLVAPTHGQQYNSSDAVGGPFSRTAVPNAPFSAVAKTIFRETLPDGSLREHTVNAHYYRDSQGRVRAELETAGGQYVIVQLFSLDEELVKGPTAHMRIWVLDPAKRTYRVGGFWLATSLVNGEGRIALPVGKLCFQRAPPVLTDASDAERLRAVNAQVSPDLDIVISSRRSDHIGSVDYELTNIRREEPPAKLFEVPTDYTFVSVGTLWDPLVIYAPWQSKRPCELPPDPRRGGS